jgi:hypothetical protein
MEKTTATKQKTAKTRRSKAASEQSKFYVTDDGVYAKSEKEGGENVFICSPLRVVGTRYVAGHENFEEGFFLNLEWKAFGQVRSAAIPRGWLAKGTAKILKELQRGGFGRVPITRRQKALFIEYLMSGRPYLMSAKSENADRGKRGKE